MQIHHSLTSPDAFNIMHKVWHRFIIDSKYFSHLTIYSMHMLAVAQMSEIALALSNDKTLIG